MLIALHNKAVNILNKKVKEIVFNGLKRFETFEFHSVIMCPFIFRWMLYLGL